jgi:hypothetical protein
VRIWRRRGNIVAFFEGDWMTIQTCQTKM